MAHVTQERTGQMLQTVLEVLTDHPEGLQARDTIRAAADRMTLSEYEKGSFPSSPTSTRFDTIIRFYTINAVKAGWMTKSRSEGWRITDEGRTALEAFPDPADLTRESQRLYEAWKRGQPSGEEAEGESEATAVATLEEAEESAWSQVRAYIHGMPPYEFQNLVAALLEAMGYHVAWIAPPGPDRGIDIIAHTDPLGAEGPRIKVQVKRLTGQKISADDLRSFMAVLGAHDIGIYVTASTFTSNAFTEARMQESRRITLLDLEALFDLWVRYYSKVSESSRKLLPLEPVYFLSPED